MGMDLVPLRKGAKDLYYTWQDYADLLEKLDEWGVDISEFTDYNDGEVISEAACLGVADAIEAHLSEFTPDARRSLAAHVEKWRNSGGFAQW